MGKHTFLPPFLCPVWWTEKHSSTHVTGDDAGPGVRGERDDAVSGLSQDGADFGAAHDALKEGRRQKA